ncbi:MAG: beta-ketoacyl-[acyl-carrier-protein] synthase family protein [Deltaproteobacteria bacterium]|nr:beta-ketoacyl-[acyl-carrier-protein] synthase family protein [Deltaproteobacteria bacterium]
MHQVAITGIGIVSCLGTGTEKVLQALKEGRSGIVLDEERKEAGFRSALTGRIEDFKKPGLERKKYRTMTDFGIQAYGAALEAIAMAGWNESEIKSDKTGLIIGNDSTTLANYKQVEITRREKSTFPIGAGIVFQALNSTVTMNLNTILGTMGASWTLSGACASGGHAIGQAGDLIAMGRQERIICGGAQEINWESVSSFDATNAFSLREDDPPRASRPFDAKRDGLVPSGGAAIVALERLDLAKKRGAHILAIIRSYAFSSDGANLSVPSGEGLERCIRECLNRGKTSADAIDYISAHATSTPIGDAAEARAIHGAFGDNSPWISSTKSMTGHEMWMAGAAQAVYSILMSRGRFIAPNINFKKQEEGIPKLNIAAETIDKKPDLILCNSAGFGGTNSCLLLDTCI